MNPFQQLVEEINGAEEQPIPEQFSTVDLMIDAALDHARHCLMGTDDEEEGMLPTWALLTQKGQVVIMATPFGDGDQKDMVAEGIKKLMSELHVIRYTFTTEAWMATGAKDTPWSPYDTPPSQRADRKEVVMVTGGDRIRGETMRLYDIVRDEDNSVTELKFNKQSECDKMEGRFSGMLEVARH